MPAGMRFRARRRAPRTRRRLCGMRFRARRKTFRRGMRFRRNGTKRLANRLRKYLNELKWAYTQHGTRAASTTMNPTAVYKPFYLARGGGDTQREGDSVRMHRYSWQGQLGGARVNLPASHELYAGYYIWEFIVYIKGDTTAFFGAPDQIYEDVTTNAFRIYKGFNSDFRRDWQLLYARRHKMRAMGLSGDAEGMLVQGNIIHGAVGVNYLPIMRNIGGSINLKAKVARYSTDAVAYPKNGGIIHYFCQELEAAVIDTYPSVWLYGRYSYWDD